MNLFDKIQGTIENGGKSLQKQTRTRKPALFNLQVIRDDSYNYDALPVGDTPAKIAEYYNNAIKGIYPHNETVESFVVILLNTRRKIQGHFIVSTGILDTLLVHPREVFKGAIVANAAAIILMHNHPSGDPAPSEADIKVTRDLIRGGQLLKIEVLDHVIMGENRHCSLRELGYFYL
jgi:DNA repair protein RadC